MKQASKKLQVGRETLRDLTAREMFHVVGGQEKNTGGSRRCGPDPTTPEGSTCGCDD